MGGRSAYPEHTLGLLCRRRRVDDQHVLATTTSATSGRVLGAFGAAPHGRLEATAWLRAKLNGHMAARAWECHETNPARRCDLTTMTSPQPPDRITYGLEVALELLAALEDALEVVAQSDYLGVVAEVETEVGRLHRKLGFGHPSGGEDGR